ncbi:MAG: hypothetical protein OEY14_12640 [Myxococcales bacterium]|nr:hypothetical protein [Myxococcales bacterium]
MLLAALERLGASRALLFTDPASGLRAVIVLDDLRLGPAAGGVRTRAYPSLEAALEDAAGLARAMTLKCALSGLRAGGGKAVVLDHPGLDRPRAFERLGAHIEELGGLFRTAGDLGTRPEDLQAMARTCSYVHTEEASLAASVGRGLRRCAEAAAWAAGREGLRGWRAAVQGVGAIGEAVARELHRAGCELLLSDLDEARAHALAAELGGRVLAPEAVLRADCDLLSPCAIGGVIGAEQARAIRAKVLCPGANNALRDEESARILHDRGILHVPDLLASAGAVVDGIARTVMGEADPAPRIDAFFEIATSLLERSRLEDRPTPELARILAEERLRTGI